MPTQGSEKLKTPLLILEGALLTADHPLSLKEIRLLFNGAQSNAEILKMLDDVREFWKDRAVNLTEAAGGWRFSGTQDLQRYLRRIAPEREPRYSRSLMETLAIIAYRQPVTRGDIEDIRGVTVSSNIMKVLTERGWIESVGHRDTLGRPSLWATTAKFLEDFSLKSLEDLPEVAEPEAMKAQFGEMAPADIGLVEDQPAAPEPVPDQQQEPAPDSAD